MNHRRSFALLLLLALLVPMLVACGENTAAPAGEVEVTPAAQIGGTPDAGADVVEATPANEPPDVAPDVEITPLAAVTDVPPDSSPAAATMQPEGATDVPPDSSPEAATAQQGGAEEAVGPLEFSELQGLIGADPTRENAPEVANAEAARQYEGVTITYYGDTVGTGADLDAALAGRFQQDTGINVNIIPKPQDATENFSVYQRLFQAQSPDVDVMMIDVIWPGAFAPHLADLSPLSELAELHYPGIIENNTVDGKLVAMPWFGDFGMLYYRTDLLEKYGFDSPPETWEELETMAQRILEGERANNADFTGFVFQGKAYEGLTCDALEWQTSVGGGELINEEGEVVVATPEFIEMMNRVKGWVGTIAPRGVTGYAEEEARLAFQGGNAAFMRNWPYAYSLANSDDSPIKGNFSVAPLPTGQSGGRHVGTVGGWQLGVSNYSRNKEAAMEFVRYMTSPEVQAYRAVTGSYVPTIPAVVNNAAVIEAMPFLENLADVERVTRPSGQAKERYNEVSTAYFQGINQILNGADAAQVLPQVEQRIQRITR